MKLIIPMAGKGEKLKPHTNITPRALVHVAGKTLLEHVLESVKLLPFDKAIFIVDKHYPELEKFIEKNYSFKAVFVLQKERKGAGHAIFGARKYTENDEVLILFSDTLIETNFKGIKNLKSDGIIWTKKVSDPRNYGVTFKTDGFITKLIEKPQTPISDEAIVGLYYFKKGQELFLALEHIINNDIKTKGEYQVTDAIQLMIDRGSKLITQDVKIWQDCGTASNVLLTNKYLLKKIGSKINSTKNTLIIKPAYIESGADISNSIIGPNVSIGKNAIVQGSIISNSIINEEADINHAMLVDSIIGRKAKIFGSSKKLNLGEFSEINY